jgi:hypothetical protein
MVLPKSGHVTMAFHLSFASLPIGATQVSVFGSMFP